MSEQITISKEKYDGLIDDQNMLEALRAAGVDNWEGYSEAVQIYREAQNLNEPECTCGASKDPGSCGHAPSCPRRGMD